MTFDTDNLYRLLPEVYRASDAEVGSPLRELLSIIAEQVGIIEEDLEQLYDDMFVETCAEWVVPYIGDLIGARAAGFGGAVSQRARVANTLTYRRRKGTLATLEQLARDVTGWPAHAVEFFQVLDSTQNVNHAQPRGRRSPELRRWEPLERANGPFDGLAHNADVRRIGRGRHNIPNIGIYLWRQRAYPLRMSPPRQIDDRRYFFDPVGVNKPLFTKPEPEPDITHLVEPINAPVPISRRVLHEYPHLYYGPGKSILVSTLVNGERRAVVPGPDQKLEDLITVSDLSDLKDESGNVTGWANMPQSTIAIDPVLGRLAFPSEAPPPKGPRVTYRYGFAADMGGGEYDRAGSLDVVPGPVRRVPGEPRPSLSHPSVQSALDALKVNGLLNSGVVEITDNGRYRGTLEIETAHPRSTNTGRVEVRLEVRAANRRRPSLILDKELSISGPDAEVTLNGLLIGGRGIRVTGGIRLIRLRHCTLVPGLSLFPNGKPESGAAPSLIVESENTAVVVDRCILGGLRVSSTAKVRITDSIVDATDEDNLAYAAPDDDPGPGGPLSIEDSTVIGKMHTQLLSAASNTIFLSPVMADRRQEGCVRFSYLPLTSKVPSAYRCRPESAREAVRMRPLFSSLRYADPGYCQLSPLCATEIRQGAEDEAEMGAFHELYQPQREANLRAGLEEYLRFGMEAGVFYAS